MNLPNFQFLVTTRLESVAAMQNAGYSILMLDGTVPGFEPRPGIDFLYDHHKKDGGAIQLNELPRFFSLRERDRGRSSYKASQPHNEVTEKTCFVTTMVDADACVAAAYMFLSSELKVHWEDELSMQKVYMDSPIDWLSKLVAIAFDCDHLYVPSEYEEYADFAAQAVAAMKENSNSLVSELGLSPDRRQWSIDDKERFASMAFKQGTEHLIEACLGKRPFPGELGEAASYWEKVEADTQMLSDENRVFKLGEIFVIDMEGLGGRYIDPRCALRVIQASEDSDLPITLTRRAVYIKNEFKGHSYTIGSIPWHLLYGELDFTHSLFNALTEAEVAKGGDPEVNKWGGRATVGGSGWNAVSLLSPQEIIDVVGIFVKIPPKSEIDELIEEAAQEGINIDTDEAVSTLRKTMFHELLKTWS